MSEKESTVYVSPGRKLDGGKPRYELIPPEALEALAQLYTDGAAKYGDRNWEKGMSASRLFGALSRHAWKWFRGEDYDVDPQTGAITHHLIQVAWNAFAIYTLLMRGLVQYDDRPTTVTSQASTPAAPTQPDSPRLEVTSDGPILSAEDKAYKDWYEAGPPALAQSIAAGV